MIVEASAPSNIALIKYMGKIDTKDNTPTNSSLSWTLDELRTYVRLTLREDFTSDQWKPMKDSKYEAVQLNEASIQRFLNHFSNIKKQWSIEKCFLIESVNTFPSDCGLASSASSFAALTKAAVEMFQELAPRPDIGIAETAELSRKGSGSSCRSFFGPWALWHKDGVRPLEFPMSALLHQVIVVDDKKKQVSSSEAHKRVPSSSLFAGRVQRAERRLAEMVHALQNNEWKAMYETAWAEFLDMHSLFETAEPPFSYMEAASTEVLDAAKNLWASAGDGPIVTMDAGANVHFLWRQDQLQHACKMVSQFKDKYRVFSCQQVEEAMLSTGTPSGGSSTT